MQKQFAICSWQWAEISVSAINVGEPETSYANCQLPTAKPGLTANCYASTDVTSFLCTT